MLRGEVGRHTGFDPERLDGLAPAERRVAHFLMDAGPDVLVLSAAALATRLGTSDATVVRTAKALGFAGMAELRQALAERQLEQREAGGDEPPLALRLQRTLADSEPDQLLATSVANHLSGLDSLARRVTPDVFSRAVNVLGAGERIVWRGVGPSACLADYGRLLCEQVGRRAAVWTHTGTAFADELAGLAVGDVVVALAYGRLQNHVHALIDHAAALGTATVLVTDVRQSRVAGRVSMVLESGRGVPGLFASHTNTLVLVEALVLGLAALDEDRAEASLAALNDLRAVLAGRRLDVDAP
jgi:DNA-binding MurR/RpiR family transcriptional regulator